MAALVNKVFCLSGAREVVSEARAVELVAAAGISDYNQVEIIKLSNKSITDKAAEYIATEVLSKCVNVKIVDISDCIAGRPEDEALRSLNSICDSLAHSTNNIVEVNVSDNALGIKGINACRSILTGKSIEVSSYLLSLLIFQISYSYSSNICSAFISVTMECQVNLLN